MGRHGAVAQMPERTRCHSLQHSSGAMSSYPRSFSNAKATLKGTAVAVALSRISSTSSSLSGVPFRSSAAFNSDTSVGIHTRQRGSEDKGMPLGKANRD